MTEDRSQDWLRQAKNDLKFARVALEGGFYSQTCFICQQAAEKAMKATLYSKGAKAVITHSLRKLCEELGVNLKLIAAAKVLDQYYLSGRYPDALPDGAPFETFTETQARDAFRDAKLFIAHAVRWMKS